MRQFVFNILVGCLILISIALIILLWSSYRKKRLVNEMLEVRVRNRTRELEQNSRNLLLRPKERSMV